MMRIYIGFDPREADAYIVAQASLVRHASTPISVKMLELDSLKKRGQFDRPFRTENGQMIDEKDGRPFSTQFAFTRFLVPYLNDYHGWAIFCDCDFLFTDDIAKLVPLLDPKFAVMVVKHDYEPKESVKMDGQSQVGYPRKNWSSFIAFNCSHPSNALLTPEVVNSQTGRWLHGFGWLDDDEIGELPVTWNWLAGVTPQHYETPKAIHFTLGVPSMPGHEHSPYADLWREELKRAAHTQELKYG